MPDYIAAASFATGLVLTECVRQAASLDDEKLRSTASDLDCNTFYGRFHIDSGTGIQTAHRVLLIRWQGDHKVLLASRYHYNWMHAQARDHNYQWYVYETKQVSRVAHLKCESLAVVKRL